MLDFTIFRIPVRIQPMFWLVMGLFGFMASQQLGDQRAMLVGTALFILIALVSILLHELGHAIVGRYFTKSQVEIQLVAMGGFARFFNPRFTKWQHIIMVIAGPSMNFILAVLFYLIKSFVAPQIGLETDNLLGIFLSLAVFINIFWGAFNLVPVFPLDGGQIMHSFIRNQRAAHQISFVVAIIMIGVCLSFNFIIGLFLFAYMAFENYQAMNNFRR